MRGEPAPADVESFRALVARRLGLHFDDSKIGLLAGVLRDRLQASRLEASEFLSRLDARGGGREEVQILARELTVAETYFFRNPDQFRAFAEVSLPERMREASGCRRVCILSAGCASGEEPYTLAILACERLGGAAPGAVSIRAFDVNPAMLERAARARYSAWSLRETPEEVQKRWFRREGRDFVLEEPARALVAFEERNLIEEDPALWQPGTFDVVFCRNVIMYFEPALAETLVARLATALAPGGYLFLGHAETLRGLSHDFHLRHTHDTFYYQRREAGERPLIDAVAAVAAVYSPRPVAPLASFVEATDSWVEAIRRSSERIEALAQSPAAPAGGRPLPSRAGGPAGARWDLGHAIDLLQRERYGDALALVRSLPPEADRDPDVMLLRAVLLTHSGELAEAARACEALLALDDLNAGARYLAALCREGLGDRKAAREQDQIAAYLDPGFAMPRLHLGLLARRSGDRDGARRELGQALVLLQREDASRLLLFGGGFSRDALVALCRAELAACGGAA